MAASAPATPLPAAAARIAAFMRGFSIEATRPADADIAALSVLASGTRIYVSAVPGRPVQESLAAAIRLRSAGFEPVPHVAVRNFASSGGLSDFLERLNGDAEVQRVLVIAGDRDDGGPFQQARDAIASGLLQRSGIRAIGIAAYPEGHPRIGGEELDRALAEKIASAEAGGLAAEIVTQFCFDARAILAYVARLRASGVRHPMRIGLAGPTSPVALLRYAARCGVRASAQAIARRTNLIRQMFAVAEPDDLVRGLAEAAPDNVSAHFFSFGGLPACARWGSAVAEGRIAIDGEAGFRVTAPAED
jgi:methylenetetrahydrofolate reductase (NADPH)